MTARIEAFDATHASSGIDSGYRSRQMPVLELRSAATAASNEFADASVLANLLDDDDDDDEAEGVATPGAKYGREATTVARRKKPSLRARLTATLATARPAHMVGLCVTRKIE